MKTLGWDPFAADHEDAHCQFEINWTFCGCADDGGPRYFLQVGGANSSGRRRAICDICAEAISPPDRIWAAPFLKLSYLELFSTRKARDENGDAKAQAAAARH